MEVVTDGEVYATDRRRVVDAMADALREHAAGTLVAPPRFSLSVPEGGLVFTAGAALDRGAMGFRVYDTVGAGADHTQLVAVYDSATGAFRGLCAGDAVGRLRTGGIGGVAVDRLAPDAATVGVLGSGNQARAQLEAVAAVCDIDRARVYSPTAAHREAFAETLAAATGDDVTAVADPERAVRGADAVLCATDSERPVFDPDWLAPGAHVTSVGPAFADAHELPPAVADRADAVVTDSLAQVEAYREEGREFLVAPERLVELSALVAGDARPERRERGEALTLFCSVGLAGTEVALADAVLDRADGT